MLAGIQKAGGIGSLKKVDRSQIRDRSGAAVPGNDTGPHGSGLPQAGMAAAAGGAAVGAVGAVTMADALAAALNERNKKVSASGKCRTTPGGWKANTGGACLLTAFAWQMTRITMTTGIRSCHMCLPFIPMRERGQRGSIRAEAGRRGRSLVPSKCRQGTPTN